MEILDDWVAFLLRWGHVLAGITWVGTSFYFNWFDQSVRPTKGEVTKENVRGTLTEVHGGSFYYHEQFWPDSDPPNLLHHSGPAQLTFATGVLLLAFIYWWGARAYLIDPSIMDLDPVTAVVISMGSLTIGWLLYYSLCRMVKNDRTVFICVSVAVVAASWVFFQIFSPRAAVLHIGAVLGTIMAMNVIFVIVPCHIQMRTQIKKGETLDTGLGNKAKRHSHHNNYFTLPVIFAMIGIHFPAAFGQELAWVIIPLAMLTGVLLRHYRNLELSTGIKRRKIQVLAGAILLSAIAITVLGTELSQRASTKQKITDGEALTLITTHCSGCHSSSPTNEGFDAPPAGLILKSIEDVQRGVDKIYEQTIVGKIMPLGNSTGMTEEERAAFGVWLKSYKPTK